ncbi:MAG TPA: hypothetical protein VGJ77_16870 [Gaiellaceae bacterium]|jgi:hypothetical protein
MEPAPYLDLLQERLGDELLGVWIFDGGELLVIVASPLDGNVEQELVDAVSDGSPPQFRTREQLGRTPEFVDSLRREAVEVWRHPTRPVTL